MSHELTKLDTSCRKCKGEMPPCKWQLMKVLGYLCPCGHWNNLKTRKGFNSATKPTTSTQTIS